MIPKVPRHPNKERQCTDEGSEEMENQTIVLFDVLRLSVQQKCTSRFVDLDIVDEGPGWRRAPNERQYVSARAVHRCLHESVLAEPANATDDLPVPQDIDMRAGLVLGAGERRGREGLYDICRAFGGLERVRWGEGAGEVVGPKSGAKQRGAVPGVRVLREEKDRGIEVPARRTCPDPVGIRGGEAEIVTSGETFKAAIWECGHSGIATRESHRKVALAGVDSSGGVGCEEVEGARVRRGYSVNECTPDIEECASTAVGAAPRPLQSSAQAPTSYWSMKANPMYPGALLAPSMGPKTNS